MKRLTFKKSVEGCDSQWQWVKRRKKAGDKRNVDELKAAWCKENGFEGLLFNCFFCEYARTHIRSRLCSECPGRKIDPDFHCENPEYNFLDNPIAFANKIRSLKRTMDKKPERR